MNRIPSLRISTAEGCNHRCSFCQIDGDFASDCNGGRSRTWVQDVVRITKRFFELGVRHFSITGGEPLVNPAVTFSVSAMLREMLDAEKGEFADSYLRLNTNGVFVTRYIEQISRLYSLVKISLHSLQVNTYASITGSHSPEADLKSVLEGIEELDRRGVPMRIQSVVMPENMGEIWQLIELCQRFPSVVEFKLFDMSEYTILWRDYASGAPFWKENFIPLDWFAKGLEQRGAVYLTSVPSVGGYGNPMPLYRFGNLQIRLRRSDRGAHYREECSECPAFSFCTDGHCNLEVGPNSLIKVCRPKEGPVFHLGEEEKAIAVFMAAAFNPREDMRSRLTR